MDIDLLLFGEEVIDGQDFQVPHRGISRMRDLAEVAARGDVLSSPWTVGGCLGPSM